MSQQAKVALTSDDLHWFDDAFRAWENNDFVGVLDGLNAVVGTAKTILPDPCPGCERGAVCRTPTCGRIRSSELMRLYGTAIEASDAEDAALTDERIADMGHRYAWRYKQATADGPFYTFNAHCLRDFARAIERELKGGDSWSRVTERKPNGEPANYERAAMSTHQPKESGNG